MVNNECSSITWRCLPMGEAALLVEGTPALPLTNRCVLALANQCDLRTLPGVYSVVPALASALIIFDPQRLAHQQLEQLIHELLANVAPVPEESTRVVSIPVIYGGEAGPDLEEIAQQIGISPQEVVAQHCGRIYRVMMLGFAPGFPYIGSLPAQLVLSRRTTPRPVVPAGSVAIAGEWTGIYPARLPGGWHLIGRTSIQLFDPTAMPPAALAPGDGIQFVPQPEGLLP